ncbi:hypothetical protein [Phenylobacterium sp.]|uniref:hypothetical protein n=1 Tax=Phenylobacterium sp. TaxID=1871053 RepID=UPI0025E46BEB|nr:hypothetical protein [Phenylobacterium sp.]MCA3716467.1 hypothetical protein [Phenylobacterium sp.]
MNTAQVLRFPPRALVRAPQNADRLVLMHDGLTAEYESFAEFEAEYEAMLIREGWTPPPQAVADAPSPPQAEARARPRPAAPPRPVTTMHDVLIVGLGLAAVLLALAAGL